MRVEYTLYEDYLVRSNQGRHIYPKYIIARLSNLRLLNWVIKTIAHKDAWYLPKNPEFPYGCLIRISGKSQYLQYPGITMSAGGGGFFNRFNNQ